MAKAEAATTTKISTLSVVDDIAMTKDDAMDDDDDASIVVTSILESNTSAKSVGGFRSYGDDDDGDDDDDDVHDDFGGCGGTPKRVLMHYRDMRTYQTVEFHDRMATKYSFEDGKYRCAVLCRDDNPTSCYAVLITRIHPRHANPFVRIMNIFMT